MAFKIIGQTASVLYALILLVPIYYMFVSAFKTNMEIFLKPLAMPERFSFDKFKEAERVGSLMRAYTFSILITGCAEVLVLVLAMPAAYAIARIRTRLATGVAAFFGTGFLIPAFAMMLPIFVLISQLGLLYNPMALIIFYPVWRLPFTVTVLVSYLKTVPRELEESAEIDGATRLKILGSILVPLVKPGVVTVVILNFISIWNEFLFALILLDQQSRTVQVAVSVLKGDRLTDYGMLAAGVVISILPVVIVFLFFQRQIIGGLYSGAVKG